MLGRMLQGAFSEGWGILEGISVCVCVCVCVHMRRRERERDRDRERDRERQREREREREREMLTIINSRMFHNALIDISLGLTVLHLSRSPASTLSASMTMRPAITALVVAIAGMMFPAIASCE